MNIEKLTNNALTSLVNHAIDNLEDQSLAGTYGCDLHNELFNRDYFIVYHHRAIEWLKECGIDAFEAIDEVIQYENDNFGEVSTKISPESIVNMYAYIAGEAIMAVIETLNDKWDERLTEEDIEKIIEELKNLIK